MSIYSPLKRAYQAGVMSLAGILAGAGCATQTNNQQIPQGMSVASMSTHYDVKVSPTDSRFVSSSTNPSRQPVTTIDDLLESPGFTAKINELDEGKSFYSINPNITGVDTTRAYMSEKLSATVHAYRTETHNLKGLKNIHGAATLIRYHLVPQSEITPELIAALDKDPEFIQYTNRKGARTGDAIVAAAGGIGYVLGVSKFQDEKAYRDAFFGALSYFGFKQIGKARDVVQTTLNPASPTLDGKLNQMLTYLVFDSQNNPIMLQSHLTKNSNKDAKDLTAYAYHEYQLQVKPGSQPVNVRVIDQMYFERKEDYAALVAFFGGAAAGRILHTNYGDKVNPSTIPGGEGPGEVITPPIVTPPTPPFTGGEGTGTLITPRG